MYKTGGQKPERRSNCLGHTWELIAVDLELCSLVAASVLTTTLHKPPSSGHCKSVWDVSLTCFTPAGYKGFILVKESKISGIIRRRLRGSGHRPVEYMHVNLLDAYQEFLLLVAANREHLSWTQVDCFCPFLTALRVLLKCSH